MDAVILAAGKGSRLDGVAPPYWKPLLPINGQPLITQAVDHALSAVYGDGDVVVVAAPENALQITQVLGGRPYTLVVQQQPTGPGDALLVGLRACRGHSVLVLMADNVISRDDVISIVHTGANSVGVRTVARTPEAERFTRLRTHNKTWVEKVPFTDADDTSSVTVWIGPLVLRADEVRTALGGVSRQENGERPLGHILNLVSGLKLVNVESIDIGVPEALA